MSWFNGGREVMAKSQYYVWFLGSREAGGLRGDEHTLPVIQDLVSDSFRSHPHKVTVQISDKGVKLIQSVPTISKSGKLKMEVMKTPIPAHSISFAHTAAPPHADVVASILLLFNPQTKCPVHVHCYRCDSPETATLMNNALQKIILRPENVQRFAQLERRLIFNGLLSPKTVKPPMGVNQTQNNNSSRNENTIYPDDYRHGIQHQNGHSNGHSNAVSNPHHDHFDDVHRRRAPVGEEAAHTFFNPKPVRDSLSPMSDPDYVGMSSEEESNSDSERVAKLHRALFQELKEKLKRKSVAYMPSSHPQHSYPDFGPYSPGNDIEFWKAWNLRQQKLSPDSPPPQPPPPFHHRHPQKAQHISKLRDAPYRDYDTDFMGNRRELSKSTTRLDDGVLTSSTSGFGSDMSSPDDRPPRFSLSDLRPAVERLLYDPDPHGPSWRVGGNKEKSSPPSRGHADHPRGRFLPLDRYRSSDHLSSAYHSGVGTDYVEETREKAKRLFGDTFKFVPKKRQDPHPAGGVSREPHFGNGSPIRPSPPLPHPHPHPLTRFSSADDNWVTRSRMHQSLDNLHLAAAAAGATNFSPDPSSERRNPGGGFMGLGGGGMGGGGHMTRFVDPNGRRYERSAKVDGFWKQKRASWYIPPTTRIF